MCLFPGHRGSFFTGWVDTRNQNLTKNLALKWFTSQFYVLWTFNRTAHCEFQPFCGRRRRPASWRPAFSRLLISTLLHYISAAWYAFESGFIGFGNCKRSEDEEYEHDDDDDGDRTMRILWLFQTWTLDLLFFFSNHLCIDRSSFFLLFVNFLLFEFFLSSFVEPICESMLVMITFCSSPAVSALLCKEMYKMLK